MKTHFLTLALIACSGVFGESPIQKSGAWNPRKPNSLTQRAREYSGKILSTEENASEGKDAGVNLKLETASGELLVHVGPRWYLNENNFKLTNGEPLTVIGVAFSFQGREALRASELIRGDKRLRLPASSAAQPSGDLPRDH